MQDLGKCFSKQKSDKASLELKWVKFQQDGSFKIVREKVKSEDIPDFRAHYRGSSNVSRCDVKQLIQYLFNAHQRLSQATRGSGGRGKEEEDHYHLPSKEAITDRFPSNVSLSNDQESSQLSHIDSGEAAAIVTPCTDTNCNPRNDDKPAPATSSFNEIEAKSNRKLFQSEPKDEDYLIPGRSTYKLRNVQLPEYFEPDKTLLKVAHEAIHKLLPLGDCESFDSVLIAQSLYEYWRPREPRIILMAESHVFTEFSYLNPKISRSIAEEIGYAGPRDFVSLVYCLAYGEKECLDVTTSSKSVNTKEPENIPSDGIISQHETQCKILTQASGGTPQFWKLLAGCLGQTADDLKKTPGPAVQVGQKRKAKTLEDEETSQSPPFAMISRLRRKLQILNELKDKGIWLIDASIVGWYIPQQQQYAISKNSFTVHKLDKKRPPSSLKNPTLLLSWELYIKHVIRNHASSLRLLIPIGKEVERAITLDRMRLAVGDQVRVMDSFPAPNAWCIGGYGPVLEEIGQLVSSCLLAE